MMIFLVATLSCTPQFQQKAVKPTVSVETILKRRFKRRWLTTHFRELAQ